VYEYLVPATRKNRLNNPLRKLRLILGDGETPAGQVEFANHIGMSVATVRAIEAGRRPFSLACQLQIRVHLCARWHPQKKQWCVLDSDTPYQKEHADFAEMLDPHEPYVDDYNIHRLIERILTMFKGCPTRAHHRGLLMSLFRHLKETAKDFHLRADLKPTEPEWKQTRNPNVWGKPLALHKDVVFWPVYRHAKGEISPHQDVGGIFDFRSWRTFHPDDYPQGRPEPEQDARVQEATADTEPLPEKNEILSAPIAHPKGTGREKGSFEKVSRRS
jgi:hypothetical protein